MIGITETAIDMAAAIIADEPENLQPKWRGVYDDALDQEEPLDPTGKAVWRARRLNQEEQQWMM